MRPRLRRGIGGRCVAGRGAPSSWPGDQPQGRPTAVARPIECVVPGSVGPGRARSSLTGGPADGAGCIGLCGRVCRSAAQGAVTDGPGSRRMVRAAGTLCYPTLVPTVVSADCCAPYPCSGTTFAETFAIRGQPVTPGASKFCGASTSMNVAVDLSSTRSEASSTVHSALRSLLPWWTIFASAIKGPPFGWR